MTAATDTLLGVIIPSLCIAAAFFAGWVARSVQENSLRERSKRIKQLRGARVGQVARDGTQPSHIKPVRMVRGKIVREKRRD